MSRHFLNVYVLCQDSVMGERGEGGGDEEADIRDEMTVGKTSKSIFPGISPVQGKA